MFDLGPDKIMLVVLAAFVFLGPKEGQLAARKISQGLRQLRSLREGVQSQITDALNVDPAAARPSPPPPDAPTPPIAETVPEPNDARSFF